jgi:hypothetical protein
VFVKPCLQPHIWQSRIVTGADGFYRGALDAIESAEWADCAMVHDDIGESWGTVAWLHDKPGEWWLGRYPFYVEKGWPPIMGAENIMRAGYFDSDVLLVATPERYVTLGWTGRELGPVCCILDWSRRDSIPLWLSVPRAVRCESAELAASLKAVLVDISWPRLRVRAAA